MGTLVFFADTGRRGRRRDCFYSSVTRLLSGSRLNHVAIGCGDHTLDPAPRGGDRIVPILRYIARYPGLRHFVRLPMGVLLDPNHDPRDTLRTLARWASCGRVPSNDCVSRVVATLAPVLAVPPAVVTPINLLCYLRSAGFTVEDF